MLEEEKHERKGGEEMRESLEMRGDEKRAEDMRQKMEKKEKK